MRTKMLGIVEAGFPTSAAEELIDTMSLDEYLIDKTEATYMLKVTSESMINAGILPGDLILVERGKESKKGDIVLLVSNGEYRLTYLKDIKHETDTKIEAVVTAVIRKYS